MKMLRAQENEVRIKDAIKERPEKGFVATRAAAMSRISEEAETEAQRRVKGRNTIVGTKAENKFGMKITTKQAEARKARTLGRSDARTLGRSLRAGYLDGILFLFVFFHGMLAMSPPGLRKNVLRDVNTMLRFAIWPGL